MSMQTNCVYGYGFEVFSSDENLVRFIKNHSEVVSKLDEGREILDWIESTDEYDSIKERFFNYSNLTTQDEGIYGLIADVMSKETGIRFEYHVPQDGDGVEQDVIILPQTNPWNFNEVEKNLTEENLEEICNRYIEELEISSKPNYIKLEYFG